MPSIQISKQNYGRLQKHARPFDDTPDSVIGRLLDRWEVAGKPATNPAPKPVEGNRARVGTILPEKDYWVPILQALEENGGSASAVEVIDRVGELMEHRLRNADHGETSTGGIRWRKRTQFARLRMKEQGLLASDSPRGIWTTTDRGRLYLEESR
jgi:hypothetical protein